MRYDAIIVGGGIAGLTSAAFLVRKGYKILICEKEKKVGGLIKSFYLDGFLYDGGVRGIINSGIVKPMLKQLGVKVDFVKSEVSLGIEKEFMKIKGKNCLDDYRGILLNLFPESKSDIYKIIEEMKKVMNNMKIMNEIENPLFKDLKNDREYIFKKLLPWLFKFLVKSLRSKKYNKPVNDYLEDFTDNKSLIDIITQHFFRDIPASFALNYFNMYMDYEYPKEGTYNIVEKLKDYILKNGGDIKVSTEISKIDVFNKRIFYVNNNTFDYDQLIWASDTNKLYKSIDMETVKDKKIKTNVEKQKSLISGKRGGDSVYTLFLAVDIEKEYFSKISTGHFFYTPRKEGQSNIFGNLSSVIKSEDKDYIKKWISNYLEYTTYEISIPVLRNEKLAPKGKTGLIISVLMDYDFINNVKKLGFYEGFKSFTEGKIIEVLDNSIYKGIKGKVIYSFSSTPLTIEKLSGNLDGAINGWAYTNDFIPAVAKMLKINKTCFTPIPDILQAGQWTYSPSGVPISILTGKVAANRAIKNIEKQRKYT
ncbi:MAG: phytoene desaturase family protein [Thermotogota bacterium]